MPVPPEVITSTLVGDRHLQCAPHRVTVGDDDHSGLRSLAGQAIPTMIGPLRSSYTPAAARVEAMMTRPVPIIGSRSRLATLFVQHPDIVDAGGGVDGLDHVVESQCRDTDRCQRLHFHAGTVGGTDGRGDADGGLRDLEFDIDPGQPQVMAQRNQVAGALGGQDACHPRGGQRVTFGQAARRDEVDHLGVV